MPVNILGIQAADAMLAQYAPKEMRGRMQRATLGGARAARPFIKAEAPKKTGKLRSSVKARKGKATSKLTGSVLSAVAGPTAPYRHLVIRGHRIVGHKPNKTTSGRFTKSNPFVDRAMGHAMRVVADVATKELMKP